MKSIEEYQFQIVAFSPNEARPFPNDIIKIFLNQFVHKITAESVHAISCEFSLPVSKRGKIMMISIPDITRTYDGLTDVDFYFLFVHLQNDNAQKEFELICSYMKKNCDLNKKIYVFGVVKDNFKEKKMTKENVKKILEENNMIFKYYEINLNDEKKIGDIILNILLAFSQKRENKANIGQHAHSCVFF